MARESSAVTQQQQINKHQGTKTEKNRGQTPISEVQEIGVCPRFFSVFVPWQLRFYRSGYFHFTIVPSSRPRLFSSQEYSIITSLAGFSVQVRTFVQSCVYAFGS